METEQELRKAHNLLRKHRYSVEPPTTPQDRFHRDISACRQNAEEALRLYSQHDFPVSDTFICSCKNAAAALLQIVENAEVTEDADAVRTV